MKPCVFCPNPRTTKRGEHIFDDWLNREDGRPIRRPSTVIELGRNDVVVRQYRTDRFESTRDVVCDECNNGWMSVLTTNAKLTLEGFIRHERPATLIELGILTTVAYAFMKAAVLDYSAEHARRPFIGPSLCHRFRRSMLRTGTGPIALPDGLQVWIFRYRSDRKMEGRAAIDGLEINDGALRGYGFLVITYAIGFFGFQLTFPKWLRSIKRTRPQLPVFTQASIFDSVSLPIWPDIDAATWPLPKYLDRAAFEDFRERFRRVNIPRWLL